MTHRKKCSQTVLLRADKSNKSTVSREKQLQTFIQSKKTLADYDKFKQNEEKGTKNKLMKSKGVPRGTWEIADVAAQVETVSGVDRFREHRDTLQYFYNSPPERAYVKEACGTGKKSIPIMFIGDQGLGTNARLKATKIRKEHHLHTVVVMTSEYRTSQTCGWCLGPVVRPRATILKDGKKKKRSVHGASLCMNTKCPLHRAGRVVQGRDYMAAICIALNGISRVIDGIHLSPFTRHSAALHMLNTSNSPDIIGNNWTSQLKR